jgi:hypothetical protein
LGAAERVAALALALTAGPLLLAPLQAQTPAESSTAWVRLESAESASPSAYVPAFGSAPATPASATAAVAPHLIRVYVVPCAAHVPDGPAQLCIEDPYSPFLDSTAALPLSPAQKAHLALHNLIDPATLATIGDTAALTIAVNSHTAYGPGWSGLLRDSHSSCARDATAEFFATFLIPSLTRQDPHYHRIPGAHIPRRILHAVSSTFIAQSNSGAPMPNFATLFTYPINAEISNLYIPGSNGSQRSTTERILTGYATDPAANLLAEFFPGAARRINLRVILAQTLLN